MKTQTTVFLIGIRTQNIQLLALEQNCNFKVFKKMKDALNEYTGVKGERIFKATATHPLLKTSDVREKGYLTKDVKNNIELSANDCFDILKKEQWLHGIGVLNRNPEFAQKIKKMRTFEKVKNEEMKLKSS